MAALNIMTQIIDTRNASLLSVIMIGKFVSSSNTTLGVCTYRDKGGMLGTVLFGEMGWNSGHNIHCYCILPFSLQQNMNNEL